MAGGSNPLSGGFPLPASLVLTVPAFIVAMVFRAFGPVEGVGLAIVFLGIVVGRLICIPAAVIDSFRSKRCVQLARWFGRLPFSAKILLIVVWIAVPVVIGIA